MVDLAGSTMPRSIHIQSVVGIGSVISMLGMGGKLCVYSDVFPYVTMWVLGEIYGSDLI